MLTTRGSLTVSTGATRGVQMWFCADTSCTTTAIVIQEISKFRWGTPQPCLPGSVVYVNGNLDEDVKEAILARCPVVIR